MVLKFSHIIFLLSIVIFIPTDGKLLVQYQNRINRGLAKTFDAKPDAFELTELNSPINNTEAYAISHNQSEKGFLFVKEVKSCSLNGCVSKEILNDNLGSEYYDIAVVTDSNYNILSIKVLDYFSDYGYEIASTRYLKQYRGKNICMFSLESPLVDGISGATISYNAMIGSLTEFCSIQKAIANN